MIASVKIFFKNFGLTESKLKEIIQQVRGSQKVTNQNPEGKYEALEKYGRDSHPIGTGR
jgi:ATP-dependent Clp protease ATP-binding subunit ClpB